MTAPVLLTPPPGVDGYEGLPASWLDALVAAATPVDEPPLAPSPVNIVTASRANPDPANTRWQDHGVAYTPESGAALGAFGIMCPADVDPDLSDVSDFALAGPRQWTPYVVWAAVACSTFGVKTLPWKARLTRTLDVAMPKAIEHELWTGEVAQANDSTYITHDSGYAGNTWLARAGADGATDVTPGAGAVSVRRGIALLEQALADCGAGARGMIHLRPEVTPDLTVVRRSGNMLLTARDTIVVPGAGYPNTSPAGAPASAGSTWMYATGRTDVRYTDAIFPVDPGQGNDWLGQVIRRDDNMLVFLGMREAIASWDGVCHFAVHVDYDT